LEGGSRRDQVLNDLKFQEVLMRYLYSREGYYDCEETDRAVEAYLRSGGFSPPQPCRYESGREGNKVILRNVRGELARYRIQANGKLRRLPVRDE
jgi:hypothetical protein